MKNLLFPLLLLSSLAYSQYLSSGDSLRGYLSEYRTSFDVKYYDVHFEFDIPNKSIAGMSHITFESLSLIDTLQLDLFKELTIDSVSFNDELLRFERRENAFFVYFNETLKETMLHDLIVYYHGKPIEAKKAPWDGGFTWAEDANNNPWIGTSVQGIGASLFWPCKDHQSDEPDSMRISATIPSHLMFASNGNLEYDKIEGTKRTVGWKVSYPINNYCVSLNIGDYVNFKDYYVSLDGDTLDLDYYVLSYNIDKAKEQFKQVQPMLRAYENHLGKYPFWEDGYSLIETPYLGMEHQSGIAYGNEYKPGYRNRFYPGFEFDYIIIHETGHEYWGNSVTSNDIADMWIHESFCTYTEALYVEDLYGYEKALEYMLFHRKNIRNDKPVQGPRDVNTSGSHDMYYKGSWMLHSMRHMIDNDSLWMEMMRGASEKFYISNIDREDMVNYFNETSGMDLTPIFNHFLDEVNAPILEYKWEEKEGGYKFYYRWAGVADDFNMPVRIKEGKGEWITLNPRGEWQTMDFQTEDRMRKEFGVQYFYFIPEEKK